MQGLCISKFSRACEAFREEECNDPLIFLEGSGAAEYSNTSLSMQHSASLNKRMNL